MLSRIRQTLDARANQHVGYLAEFSDPGMLYDAVKSLRQQGYSRLDTFSPFPIHGMDKAMGLGVSPLGFFVFVGGTIGAGLGIFLQWWTSAGPQFDWMVNDVTNAFVPYAINVSNKPLFSLEASVPVAFELTILFSALTAVLGMILLNGLPKPYNPLFNSQRFSRATDDGFFLHIAEADENYDATTTARALFDVGALHVEHVDHEGTSDVDATGRPIEPASAEAPVLVIAEPGGGSTEAVPALPAPSTGEI
ncbi:MAG: DUF3341 domain-containing protein [Bacteroidota bacterium]